MADKRRWGRGLLLGTLLVAATLAAYQETRHFDFTNYDDADYVTQNPMVRQGLTAEGLRWGLTTTHFSYWHPLTWWSHMLDVEWHGLDAGGHHLTNVILHVAATLVLFLALHRMTGRLERSAFVAGLFALHPLHVESVAWIAERKDVLSTLFWFLTLWAYTGYVRRPARWRYGLCLVFFALGLMSKPMLVTVPAVLLLLDLWPLGRLKLFPPGGGRGGLGAWLRQVHEASSPSLGRLLLEKVPFLLLAVASAAVTFIGVYTSDRMLGTETMPLGLRLANVPVSYLRYIVKMFIPENMVVLYPMPSGWAWWEVLGSCGLLLAVTAGVLMTMRRAPYLLVGWLWFLGTLLPTIGIIPVGWQSIADRYTYVPLVGLFIMVTWLVAERVPPWPQRRWVLGTVSVLILAGLTYGTHRQTRHWRNNETLFRHAVQASTNNALAHYNLALTLQMQNRWSEAAQHYRQSIRIQPGKDKAYNNLGFIMNQLGQYDRATNILQQGLLMNPQSPSLHLNLGDSLRGLGRPDAALAAYERALELDEQLVEARLRRSDVLLALGQPAEAVRELRHLLEVEPDHVDARIQLAWVLATHPDPAWRNGREALDQATKALERAAVSRPGARLALAAARAETGDFTGAIQAAGEAEQQARKLGLDALARKARTFREAYETEQVIHEDPAGRGR